MFISMVKYGFVSPPSAGKQTLVPRLLEKLRWGLGLQAPTFTNIAVVKCIRTNQNPNRVRRREVPPHTIWVLCPNKNGDSYM
jgi:hypothetical protein